MNRKFIKVSGWWVYCYITPDGMFYIGCSGEKPYSRCRLDRYKCLIPYIEKYGKENIRIVILKDGLTKEQALQLEDLLILEARKGGWCLNKKRSGGSRWNRKSVEYKEYIKTEHYKEIQRIASKKQRSTPAGKIYDRVSAFNRYHPDRIQETPLEAKQKYLQWGYIPDYIKNDDLH